VVAAIPEEWLSDEKVFSDRAAQREAYVAYLTTRLQEPRAWLTEAIDARRAS
jgi:hypothetical protein